MHVIDVKEFGDNFVVYYGGKQERINAYTLASSLVTIADAVKSANSIVNPGYEVEVVIEAFGPGSFKVQVTTLYHDAKNLFSRENLKAIVLSIIAAYIFQNTLAPSSQEPKIIINTDEVIIEQGNEKVVIPRSVYDGLKK